MGNTTENDSLSVWEIEQEARRGAFYESINIDFQAPIFSNGKTLKSLTLQDSSLSVEKLLYEAFNSIKDRADGVKEESLNGFKDFLNRTNFNFYTKEANEAFNMVEQLYKDSSLEKVSFEKKYNAVGTITYYASSDSFYTDTFYTNNAFLKDLNKSFNDQPNSIKYAVISKDEILQEKVNALLKNHFNYDASDNKQQQEELYFENILLPFQEIERSNESRNSYEEIKKDVIAETKLYSNQEKDENPRSIEDWKQHYLYLFSNNKDEYGKEKNIILNKNNAIYYEMLLETSKRYAWNIVSQNHISMISTEPYLKSLLHLEPKIDRNLFFNRKQIEEQKKEHHNWEIKINTLTTDLASLKKTMSEINEIKTDKDYISWFIQQGNKDGKCYSAIKKCFNTYLDNEKNEQLRKQIKGFFNADAIVEQKNAVIITTQSHGKSI